MKREVKHLQDAVNTIHIKEEMQQEIIQNVKNGTGKKHYLPNVAVAAVLVIILSGALSIPVRALVNSFLQERMEKVPEEELTALVEELSVPEAGIDSFSREYTEEENRIMPELIQKYQEGTFPEGELARVESQEEAEALGFCFLMPNRTFYLPDRELTEEELLQIIDFYAKRDYAVTKQYEEEYADELAQQKEDEGAKIAELVESGGITEEEAVEIAKAWLVKLYGITGEGLENNYYYTDDVQVADITEIYHVNWTDFPNRLYYYFYIDAEDGSLVYAKRSDGNREEEPLAATEANALLPQLQQKAITFVEEQVQQTYEESYYSYYSINDVLCKNVKFIFVQEDNSAFALTYFWDGVFYGFQKTSFSSYQEKYEALETSAELVESHNPNREEMELTVFLEKMEN